MPVTELGMARLGVLGRGRRAWDYEEPELEENLEEVAARGGRARRTPGRLAVGGKAPTGLGGLRSWVLRSAEIWSGSYGRETCSGPWAERAE